MNSLDYIRKCIMSVAYLIFQLKIELLNKN